MPDDAKIFGIGLSKTGTSSLAQALQRLGFSTKDCMGASTYVRGDLSSIDMRTVLAHDALTDTPIPSFYRELDARFPGSKFILTVRDRDGWLQSCRKQFNERAAAAQNDAHRQIFEDLYGTNVFDEQQFAAGYERFVAGVREYFRDRPADLLELNVSAGEGWDKLCPFLGQPVPDAPFPKANVTSIRWMAIGDLVAIAEAAGRELLKRYDGKVEPTASTPRSAAAFEAARLLERALQTALRRDAAEAAAKAAGKVIVAGLRAKSPGIPVISPLDQPVPHAERRLWNHVWLVDPLDGRGAFAHGSSAFSVNIALIEDGRPIYGIVHAPALGTTYFARIRKGAFRRSGGGEAVRIAGAAGQGAATRQPLDPGAGIEDGSRALAMCALLERQSGAEPVFTATKEWKAAAADAVLTMADLPIVDDGSQGEPVYNSVTLEVGPLRVPAVAPASLAGPTPA